MFELTEPQKMIEQAFRQYCEKEIAPHVEDMEEGKVLPFELMRKMADQFGLRDMIKEQAMRRLKKRREGKEAPKEDIVIGEGGVSMDPGMGMVFGKEMSRVSPSLTLSLGATIGLCGMTIMAKGTPDQIEKWAIPVLTFDKIGCWGLTEPDAGSDAFSLRTTARPDGDHYLLNGSKTFITNAPYADVLVVYAKIARDKASKEDKRLVYPFVVEKGTPGLSVSKPMNKMGMKGSPTGEIFLDDVRVPKGNLLGQEEKTARDQAKETLAGERSGAPSMCWGIIERCLDDSIAYSMQRKQFGKYLCEFQLIQEKLARMYVALENVKNLAFKQMWLAKEGKADFKSACAAKFYATQAAVDVGMEAIQLMGGYGYMKEYHVERLTRDAKLMMIGGGTSEIQLLNIAKGLLAEKGKTVTIY